MKSHLTMEFKNLFSNLPIMKRILNMAMPCLCCSLRPPPAGSALTS
jgi:hypothetical protein